MLIASQKPTATHVAGFHAWHKLGRFVKKGEKGIMILAPIVRRKNESAEQDETDESSTAVGFRAAYVFDISQTDGQELPTIGSVNGEPREYRERLAKFVAEQGIALEYSENIAPARGTSAGGKITLLPGQSPAEEFATLAHELAHEMMHRTERRNSTSKRIRETEAEAVAFVVSHAIGLETGSAAQDYIQLYDGDAELLTDSLERIQGTATTILNVLCAEVPPPRSRSRWIAPLLNNGKLFKFQFELLSLWLSESAYKYQWLQHQHEEKPPNCIWPPCRIAEALAFLSTTHRPGTLQLHRVVPTRQQFLANNQSELTPRLEAYPRTTHRVPNRLGLLAPLAPQRDLCGLEIRQRSPRFS